MENPTSSKEDGTIAIPSAGSSESGTVAAEVPRAGMQDTDPDTLPQYLRLLKEAIAPPTAPEAAVTILASFVTDAHSTVRSDDAMRTLSHPTIAGTLDLDEVAQVYLRAGYSIQNDGDSVPFRTRLAWLDVHPAFERLYNACDAAVKDDEDLTKRMWRRGLGEEGTACCAVCSGVPAAVIPGGWRENLALYFKPEIFRALWPGRENVGSLHGRDYERWAADREMLEELMVRENKAEEDRQEKVVKMTDSGENGSQDSDDEDNEKVEKAVERRRSWWRRIICG